MKNKVLIILIFPAILSCSKVVEDYKLDDKQSQIIVNGLLAKDSLIKFTILKTAMRNDFSKDPYNIIPENISLIINEEEFNVTIDTLPDSYTVPNRKLNAGDKISIGVSAKGFRSINSSATIPQNVDVNLNKVSIKQEEYHQPWQEEPLKFLSYNLQLNIENSEPDSYYGIAIEALLMNVLYRNEDPLNKEILNPDTVFYTGFAPLESFDGIYEFHSNYGRIISNTDMSNNAYGQILYFQGSNLSKVKNNLQIKATSWGIDLNETDSLMISVHLFRYNYDYYKYLKSVGDYNVKGEFPLSEPIYIHSNVENGRGILGAMNATSHTYYINPEK